MANMKVLSGYTQCNVHEGVSNVCSLTSTRDPKLWRLRGNPESRFYPLVSEPRGTLRCTNFAGATSLSCTLLLVVEEVQVVSGAILPLWTTTLPSTLDTDLLGCSAVGNGNRLVEQ